jgi:hypothetical protein
MIFHQENMGDLEHQLERFPYGTHDDLIDAEQGLVQLLQYPRAKKEKALEEDNFSWWRSKAIKVKKPTKQQMGNFHIKKNPTPQIPYQPSWK